MIIWRLVLGGSRPAVGSIRPAEARVLRERARDARRALALSRPGVASVPRVMSARFHQPHAIQQLIGPLDVGGGGISAGKLRQNCTYPRRPDRTFSINCQPLGPGAYSWKIIPFRAALAAQVRPCPQPHESHCRPERILPTGTVRPGRLMQRISVDLTLAPDGTDSAPNDLALRHGVRDTSAKRGASPGSCKSLDRTSKRSACRTAFRRQEHGRRGAPPMKHGRFTVSVATRRRRRWPHSMSADHGQVYLEGDRDVSREITGAPELPPPAPNLPSRS